MAKDQQLGKPGIANKQDVEQLIHKACDVPELDDEQFKQCVTDMKKKHGV